MNIQEKFDQYFSDCIIAKLSSNIDRYNVLTNEKFTIDTKYSAYSLQYLVKNFQEVAIVAEEIGDNYKYILESVAGIVQMVNSGRTAGGGSLHFSGEEHDSKEMTFNKIVYIFTDRITVDKSVIEAFFRTYGLRVKFRDRAYFEKEWEERRPDLFICHDSRDKKEVADSLHQALTQRGLKVWYDKASLQLGDSLTEKIQEGIRNCRYGVIILSPNFLSNERWAKNELQSFTTRQIIENEKVILPVWHKITEHDLKKTSYWLVDKVGGNTEDVELLATQIANVVKR